MPTYCLPALSGVPGFPASEFDWWTPPAMPATLRNSPENPNWLGAFSQSQGAGANRDMQFRALRGAIGAQTYLFLSWVVRAGDLSTTFNRVNFVLGDGTHYIAVQVGLRTDSSTSAGTENSGAFAYRIHTCTVAGTAITQVNPAAASSGAALESTGRMWVDVTNAERNLPLKWAFQVAIPLGIAWAPTALALPAAGACKLWYEVWTAVGGMPARYQLPAPASLPNVQTVDEDEVVPAGLTTGHMFDLSTSGAGCTEAVTINWGQVGVRNVAAGDPARSDQFTLRLDLGQNYPPNMAAGAGPLYNVNHTPDVSQTRFQNQIFAQPTVPASLTAAQQASLRARFSLANWGSQIGVGSSWRPVPGGTDVQYQSGSEMRFVWPLAGPGGGADSFTTTLVRNINKWLNADAGRSPMPADAQHPHQCMLVELSSTDPSVVFTRSSIYQNMNVARASVMRDKAQISVVGLAPNGPGPRDVYLQVQTFNMPKVVDRENDGEGGEGGGEGGSLTNRETDNRLSDLRQGMNDRRGNWPVYEVEDVAAVYPTFVIHAYYDSGEKWKLRNGQMVPILLPQTAFGYFLLHEGDLYGWETRLYGAEKLAENLYVVRVPNNGSVMVEPAVQARETAGEQPLPPDGKPVEGQKGCLAKILAFFGIKI